MSTDALGRRRNPEQHRGLRPLFPPLPSGMESRSMRVAMSKEAWSDLEAYVEGSRAPTRPRAVGELIERSLGAPDWQEFQIRKERQLLHLAEAS